MRFDRAGLTDPVDDISLLGYPVRLGALQRQHLDYCRRGTLLALAAPAEVVALREWTLEEFLRQLDGQQPVRWSGPT